VLSCTPCISGTDWNFLMRFSPTGRGARANFLWCFRCRQIISHAHKNSNWRLTDRMYLGSRDTDGISANFDGKPPFLRSRNTVVLVRTLQRQGNIRKMAAYSRKWIWNDISQLVCEIATKLQRLYLCFRCQATRLDCSKHCRVSGWVRNQRWRIVTGSAY